ncbi:MAG: MerR family transcriptional regulator [Methylacidiphilales bacterium]|nr:MerR family transcriptional regulator [Candidatus Methylacidiphilales bacterium]
MSVLNKSLPLKKFFSIGEVSKICNIKPYVLRYWEKEFDDLRPLKRRGNRRFYQRSEVLLIFKIQKLLHEQGFTIHGARQFLANSTKISQLDQNEITKMIVADLSDLKLILSQEKSGA